MSPIRCPCVHANACTATTSRAGWTCLPRTARSKIPSARPRWTPQATAIARPQSGEAFWDITIANSDIKIAILESHTADRECANRLRLNIAMDIDGQRYRQEVHGVFTYRVDAAGRLAALRGYWEFDEGMASLKPEDTAAA